MPQPTQTQVHVDAILTNISVAYMNKPGNYIASQAFPPVTVPKQTDKYFTYTKGDWFRDEAKKRADATESQGSGYGQSTDTYSCDVFALHKDIGDQTRANADVPLQLETDAVRFITDRMMLRQEKQFVSDAFGNSIWDTNVSGGTDFTVWSNYSSSDPISDVETGKAKILKTTGFEPNTLIVGYNVWRYLKHHPDIVDRISGGSNSGSPALVTAQLVAAIFEVDRILVAKAINNTAVEGETVVQAFTHGDHALLCYVNPNPGLMSPSAGYTFVWQGVSQGLGQNVGVKQFRIEELGADRVEGQIAFDNKIVATDMGYMFLSAV